MRLPITGLLALASLALGACGDDAGGMPDGGGAGGGGGTGGAMCGPNETESPNGVCLKNVPCGKDIPEFTIDLEAEGRDGHYGARIVDAEPSPPKQYLNAWTVEFLDASGEVVPDVEIDGPPDHLGVQPWMPRHRHDGFIPPKWTGSDADGRFTVEKINLWMIGPWEVRFWVTGPDGDDYIVFPVCVTK